MGSYAIIQDPQGATISLYQPSAPTQGFDGTPSIGRFSWNELMTLITVARSISIASSSVGEDREMDMAAATCT